jgi:hypothetical protein
MMPIAAEQSSRFVLAEDDPLLANLAALWRVDPELAGALEGLLDEPGYPTEPSKQGPPTASLPTPDGRRIQLHSRYAPWDEARRLAEESKRDGSPSGSLEPGGKGVYAIHGLGLGYHVQALFDRVGESPLIVVLEPDLRLIRTALGLRDYSRMLRTGRVVFVTQADRGLLLGKLTPHQHLAAVGIELLPHPPSMQLHPEFHRDMQRWLAEYAAYCRTGLQTLLLNGRRTCENLTRNIGCYAAAADIRRLRDRHRGQPAIIVSAGPSLRKNQHLLHQAAGRAVIIAVQTTLQPLVDMGLEPDYVTSLDYHDICTRFFEKLPRQLRTELVAEPKASAKVLGMYGGPLTLLGSDYCDKLLHEMYKSGARTPKERLRAGATVAHLAFYLAEYLGCDPIIFIGQDLAFGDGLSYAPGTSYEDVWRPELGRFCTMEMKQWEHIARERPILRRIPDWQGRPIYTEERLFTYLQQFERDFAASGRRIIDASEGGAAKRGAEPMTLAEALARYCADPLAPCSAGFEPGSAAGGKPDPRRETAPDVLRCLEQRLREAAQIADIGRRTLPLLEEVRDHLDETMRVNRAIARIDLLRQEMFALNHTYELATQLSQTSELARFQRDFAISTSGAEGTEKQRRQVERDMENVKAVIAAAGELEKLLEEVKGELLARASLP